MDTVERSHHPAVVVSAIVIAVAVTLCALVAIAWMLGWVPSRASVPTTPASVAAPGQQMTGTVHDNLGLLPGETLVTSPEPPKSAIPQGPRAPPDAKPVTPRYSKAAPDSVRPPVPPAPKPAEAPPKKTPPTPSRPMYAQPAPTAPLASSIESSPRAICVNCGTVSSITGFPGEDYEVRVRFEDGSADTFRFRRRPPLRIGQNVRYEDGRLVAE